MMLSCLRKLGDLGYVKNNKISFKNLEFNINFLISPYPPLPGSERCYVQVTLVALVPIVLVCSLTTTLLIL